MKNVAEAFKKDWLLVVITALVVLAGALIYEIRRPATYETYSVIKVGEMQGSLIESLDNTIKSVFSEKSMASLSVRNNRPAEKLGKNIIMKKDDNKLKIITRDKSSGIAFVLNRDIVGYIIAQHDKIIKEKKDSFKKYIEEKKKAIKENKNFTQLNLSLIAEEKNFNDSIKPTVIDKKTFRPEPVAKNIGNTVIISLLIGLALGMAIAVVKK